MMSLGQKMNWRTMMKHGNDEYRIEIFVRKFPKGDYWRTGYLYENRFITGLQIKEVQDTNFNYIVKGLVNQIELQILENEERLQKKIGVK